MKPTSIIFLCLSVLLIIGGVVTCFVASNMAKEAGVELFDTGADENGNNVTVYELPDDGLNKISLVLKNADVTVYGGTEKSRIELVNYSKNTYSYAISNSILSVDESIGFLSIIDFSDTSVSFDGLRHYLNFGAYQSKPRSVNVYLADNLSLKQFEVKLNSGSVTLDGASFKTDCTLTVDKGDVTLNGCTLGAAASFDIGSGDLKIIRSNVLSLKADVAKGNFEFASDNYNYQSYDVKTPGGKIYLDGAEYGDILVASTPMASSAIEVKLSDGDAYINDASAYPVKPADTSAESSAVTDAETSADTSAETTAGAA